MSRPADPAEPAERSSTPAGRLTLAVAVAATLAAFALSGLALVRSGSAAPGPVEAWLLALGMACVAAAVAWSLWRQRELSSALRQARAETLAWLEFSNAWTWEADALHRLVRVRPPTSGAPADVLTDEALGRPVWDVFDAEPRAAASLRARLESSLPLRAHGVALRGRDGHAGHPLHFELDAVAMTDESGRVLRWIGSARSVDAAQEREHERRVLHALLPALPMPVFELAGDARGPQRVQRANSAALHWLGVRSIEAAGMAVADLLSRLPPDLRAAVAQAMGEPQAATDLPASAGWQVHLRNLADEDSIEGLRHWVLVLMPIARIDPAALAADGGADSESFSYTVSHDLRAPVRVVEGFTKILKEDYGRQLDRIGNDHLDRVLGAAARMNSMIDALLALAQLSSRPLSRQPVNLSQLAAYVVEDLRRQAPERRVAIHVEGGLLAQGDPTLLRVLLENLIGNAWKYSVRARNAQIWLERGEHAGQAVFTVRDNGAGFDMRFADRLFGVFQRLHSASDFPGTGIGLATVRRIVVRHGGEIWAESVVDQGSSFHFTLPPSPRQAG